MASLADTIEEYLKMLLNISQGEVELQRSELAQRFACVPSQINYVIRTRFAAADGFLVESRRGGGGYLRIKRVRLKDEDDLVKMLNDFEKSIISLHEGARLLRRLEAEGRLTARESSLLQLLISPKTLQIDSAQQDNIRSKIIQSMLLLLLQDESGLQ